MDVREDFFFRRRGDGGCVGVTTLCGEIELSSSIDFSRLNRESSENDKTLRRGGAIGVSLVAVGVSDMSMVSEA